MKLLLIILAFVSIAVAAGAAVLVTDTSPDADAYVRSNAPAANYGAAGMLSVSGSTSAGTGNDTNGVADTFIRFNTGAMVTSFNSTFGSTNWVITGATLLVTEVGAPNSSNFDRGTGSFEIFWITNDNWTEGTGMPANPVTNAAYISYSQEASLLNPGTDLNLGTFTNSGTNASLSFSLALPAAFTANVQAGGEVGFYLTAISPGIGFTFDSRHAGSASTYPMLAVSAVAQPVISAINLSGTNVVLSVTNGVTGGTYYVLTSTNVALPPNQWTPVVTNVAGSTNFAITVTNGANTNAPSPQFFILQTY